MGNIQTAEYIFTFPYKNPIYVNKENVVENADFIKKQLDGLKTSTERGVRLKLRAIEGYTPNKNAMASASSMFCGKSTGPRSVDVYLTFIDIPFSKDQWFTDIVDRVLSSHGLRAATTDHDRNKNYIDMPDDDDEELGNMNNNNNNNPRRRVVVLVGGNTGYEYGTDGELNLIRVRGAEYYDENTQTMREFETTTTSRYRQIRISDSEYYFSEDDTGSAVQKLYRYTGGNQKGKLIIRHRYSWGASVSPRIIHYIPLLTDRVLAILNTGKCMVYSATNPNYDQPMFTFEPAINTSAVFTPLKNGKVLILDTRTEWIGILDVDSRLVTQATDQYSGMQANAKSVPMDDGRVFFTDGHGTEIYDPAFMRLTYGPTVRIQRKGFACALLSNNRILIAGGEPRTGTRDRVETVARTEIVEVLRNGTLIISAGPNLLYPRIGGDFVDAQI